MLAFHVVRDVDCLVSRMCVALVTAHADQRVSTRRVFTDEAQLLAWVMCTLRRRPVRSHRTAMCLTVTWPCVASVISRRCVAEEQLHAVPALQLCRHATVLTARHLWCGGLRVRHHVVCFEVGGCRGVWKGLGELHIKTVEGVLRSTPHAPRSGAPQSSQMAVHEVHNT